MSTFARMPKLCRHPVAFLLGAVCFVSLAQAQNAFLVSPHLGVEPRDTGTKALPLEPPTETFTGEGITFNIWYMDAINGSGLGFAGPDATAARTIVRDTLVYIASEINMVGELDILVEESDPNLYPPGFLASAGTFFPGTAGNHRGSALHRLENGTKQFANTEEINLKILFNQNWNITYNTSAPDQLDFTSIVLHELGHGFGLVSLAGSTGESVIAPNVYSLYDLIVRHPAAPSELLFDGSSGFQGVPGDLTADELIFFGNRAGQSYNRGVFPPIHSSNPFVQGTSLSHWATFRLQGPIAVMEPARIFGTDVRSFRPFEIAALRDIGYTNVEVIIEDTSADAALVITPETQLVSPNSGIATINITNISGGTILWSSSVVCPLVISVSPSFGSLSPGNAVSVSINHSANSDTSPRSCDIIFSALEISHTFTLSQEGADSGLPCLLECLSSTPDSDSDGLSDACELCLGTNPNNPDTDGDGMPDGWEVEHGFNPLSPLDANGDADGDGLTNLEEFLFGSNPLDPDDPKITRFVSPDGVDVPSHGDSLDNPWRTISFALSQLNVPANIRLAPGIYNENVALKSNITIFGPECADSAPLSNCAVIQGAVEGANGAELRQVAVSQAVPGALLLDMNSVSMTLSNVRFVGDTTRDAVGILVSGATPANSIVESCIFESLDIGIDIMGAIPKIRKNTFRNHNTAYIVIREGALVKSFGKNGGLGDATDSEVGFNAFEGPPENTAVINETGATISMENNFWGTSDASEVDARIDGPANFEPFFASGSAILASSIFCTVWEAGTQKRVLNATVDLAPGGVKSVTDNNNGVYVFAAVPAGVYTVTANTTGFAAVSQTVNVAAGQQAAIIMAVAQDGAGEGEGEGEEEEDGCGCFGGDNKGGMAATMAAHPADVLLLLLVVAVLAFTRRRFFHAVETT